MAKRPIYELIWQLNRGGLRIVARPFIGPKAYEGKLPTHKVTAMWPNWINNAYEQSPCLFPLILPRSPGGMLVHSEKYMREQLERVRGWIDTSNTFKENDKLSSKDINAFMLMPCLSLFNEVCLESPNFKYRAPQILDKEAQALRDHHEHFSMMVCAIDVGDICH
jgi:hypothetical protein